MPHVLLSGDQVVFEPAFGEATVLGSLAIQVAGTAGPTAGGRALAFVADVERLRLGPVAYVTTSFKIPGQALLAIVPDSLARTSVVTVDDKPIVLAEPATVEAKLTVVAPATTPSLVPTFDASSSYRGRARLVPRSSGGPEAI